MSAVIPEKRFGFFDISSPIHFTVSHPGREFNEMIGKETEGLSYLDLVSPEERDEVAEKLGKLFASDNDFTRDPRLCASLRHRLLAADGQQLLVTLNAGREAPFYLRCSVTRAFDDFVGDGVDVYKSNAVLESFAVSMAVLTRAEQGGWMVLYANDHFYRMIGWSRMEFKEFFNEDFDDRLFPDDLKVFSSTLSSLSPEKPECVFEIRTVTPDGGVMFHEVHARWLEEENDRPTVSVVFNDITERKRLRRDLLVKNERYSIIQESIDQVLFDYDTEHDVCYFSGNLERVEKYLALYGVKCVNNEFTVENFFTSQFARGMMRAEDYTAFEDLFANAIMDGEGGEKEFFLSFIGQNTGLWHKVIFSAVKDENGDVVRLVGRIKNIDKQKRTDALIERRIHSDLLTGLLNKDTAFAQIQAFLREDAARQNDAEEKCHALMMINIDHFHHVNEYFGRTFGDDVIREYASEIKSSFRDSDIVGRIGGDEFIVLMKNVTQKFAVKKAGRLCRSLVRNYGVQRKITLTCSIGMAFFGKDAKDFDSLYQCADWAVYSAQINGRNTYCLYDTQAHDDYRRIDAMGSRAGMDPPSSMTEINELDTNLLDIAFSLAASSDDIYGTLEILLRTVGRKYNLSAVSVLLKRYDQPDRLRAVDRWLSIRNYDRDGFSPMVTETMDIDPLFRSTSLKCVSDIAASNLPASIRSKLKNDGIYAFVWGKLEGRAGEPFGYMMFTQFNRTRKWSRKELNTFKYLSKIVSITLVDRYLKQEIQFKDPPIPQKPREP